MMIVASETSEVLCTPEPIPTDGQPQWGRYRGSERFLPRERHREAMEQSPHFVPDGPFPFTVAVWREVTAYRRFKPDMSGDNLRFERPEGAHPHVWPEVVVGAVVATAEITGPSHFPYLGMHHSRCSDEHLCYPDAAPDYFHTPTGKVTVLDRPIPCERPEPMFVVVGDGFEVVRPSVWTADDALAAKLTEVMA